MPFLVGATQDEARNRLRTAKLDPQFESEESDEPQGQVLSTDPEGGQPVDQGSRRDGHDQQGSARRSRTWSG